MKTLYFNLEQPYRYFVIDHLKEGSVLIEDGSYDDLDDIKDKTKSTEKNIAIIPGELMSIHEVNIPIKSRKKVIQAIPFALEDHLAGSIEDLHFELLDWNPGETSTVAVINREQWYGYLLWMQENSIEIHRIIADFDLLPLSDEEAAFLFEDFNTGRVLLKFRHGRLIKGLTIDKGELAYWLDEYDPTDKIILSNNQSALSELISDEQLGTGVINEVSPHFTLQDLCLQSADFQGHLALYRSNQSKKNRQKSRPWFIAAMCLLILAGIANLGVDVYEYFVLKKKQQVLTQRIEEIFQQSFPEVDRIVDAKLQFQREIDLIQGTARGSEELLFLLDKLFASFSNNAGNINELLYRNSELDVVFRVNNFQRLDQFEARFSDVSDGNAFAKRLSSDSQGGVVTAKYRLTTQVGQSNE